MRKRGPLLFARFPRKGGGGARDEAWNGRRESGQKQWVFPLTTLVRARIMQGSPRNVAELTEHAD